MYTWTMVFKMKSVNKKSRLNPQINQNSDSRIQLSELKCSLTQSLSKISASELYQIPTKMMWTWESSMTFLVPDKLINLVLLPLHLRKPDPLQPHQAPQALKHASTCTGNQPSPSLSVSPASSTWEEFKETLLVAKTWCSIIANSLPSVLVTAVWQAT